MRISQAVTQKTPPVDERMLVPPLNFGIVENGIYRCSKLESLNFAFLETLKLSTLLIVHGEEPSSTLKNLLSNLNIHYILVNAESHAGSVSSAPLELKIHKGTHYELSDADDLMILKSGQIKKIIRTLLDRSKYNMLIIDKTSTAIGLLRKIQKWDIGSIINEYRLYTGKHANYFSETFLELIKVRLIEHTGEKKEEAAVVTEQEDSDEFEDVEDDMLSSSPQIPHHMLQMIESKKEATGLMRTPSYHGATFMGSRYRIVRDTHQYYEPKTEVSRAMIVDITIEDETLPQWFTFQRDLWEEELKQEEL